MQEAIGAEGEHGHEQVRGGNRALLARGGEFRVGVDRGSEEGVGRRILSYDGVEEGFGDSGMLLPKEWDGGGSKGMGSDHHHLRRHVP